jgi:rRNA maturation endonuclease Nob1
MAIFDKIGKKLGDSTKNMKESMEANKVRGEIDGVKGRIRATYTELGEKFYMKFGSDPSIEAELREVCDRIIANEAQIADLEVKYLAAKNVWICPTCKVEIEREQKFCAVCGAKQPEDAAAAAAPSDAPPAAPVL